MAEQVMETPLQRMELLIGEDNLKRIKNIFKMIFLLTQEEK